VARPPYPLDALPSERPLAGGGLELSGRIVGRGPRCVLLHGGPGLDHHLLLPLALALAPRLQVVLPDLPGHGRSRSPAARLPDLDALVAACNRWLSGLAPPPVVLAGHSLGAHLALRLARIGAVPPKALVLLAPPAVPPAAPPERPAAPGDELSLRAALHDLLLADGEGPLAPEAEQALARSRLHEPSAHGALLLQLRRRLERPPDPALVSCPTLLVTGERDPICPPQAARKRLPGGAELLVLPGAGHFPFARDPGPTARAIEEFLVRARVLL
jgi:pimeloyl-ACP methyl ester carboxylesterase